MRYRKFKELFRKHNAPSVSECRADNVPTHREVTLAGTVKVEELKEFADHYKDAHAQDDSRDARNHRWTKISTGLIAVYAGLTFWQAYLTRQIVSDGEAQAHRDLRPYIYADKFDFLGSLDEGAFQGQVQVVNTGRTPGTQVEGCADYAFRPNSKPITDDLVCPNPENPATGKPTTGEKSKFVLGSSLPFHLYTSHFSISAATPVVPPPFNPKVPMSTVLHSGFFLYVYGDIFYTDLIAPQTIHHTYFCGRYNPDTKAFDVCEKHNSMD